MQRGCVLGDGKVQANFLEETIWELALEGRVGSKMDSRWILCWTSPPVYPGSLEEGRAGRHGRFGDAGKVCVPMCGHSAARIRSPAPCATGSF